MSSEQEEKSTPRPWSLAVETEADDTGTLIVIPEIGRCLHDFDWANQEDWDRDLANAELIVTAVNERDQLLSSLAEKQEEIGKLKGLLQHVNDAGKLVPTCKVCDEIRSLDGKNPISEPQEHES